MITTVTVTREAIRAVSEPLLGSSSSTKLGTGVAAVAGVEGEGASVKQQQKGQEEEALHHRDISVTSSLHHRDISITSSLHHHDTMIFAVPCWCSQRKGKVSIKLPQVYEILFWLALYSRTKKL